MKRAWLLALGMMLAASAAAYPESQAPELHPAIAQAWHEPDVVRGGQQWMGYLRLHDGHNITAATYQVCNAGDGVCFAPPTAATFLDDTTLRFDTTDYLANGQPVHWKAGWTVGVKWCLQEADADHCTPVPPASTAPDIADHYLTFEIASDPKEAPAFGFAGLAALAVMLAATAVLRRRLL